MRKHDHQKIWTTKKNSRIFQVLSVRSNAFLIVKDNTRILVDCGVFWNYHILRRNIEAVFGVGGTIDYLVLTHAHYDHSQNAKRVKSDFYSRIITHQYEADRLSQGRTVFPLGTNKISRLVSLFNTCLGRAVGKYPGVDPDLTVSGDHYIDANKGLAIIETPGHTLGSISLVLDDEIALVGSAVQALSRRSLYPWFADDPSMLLKTWEKLLQTGCRLFLPGHGRPIERRFLAEQFCARTGASCGGAGPS